MPSKRTPLPADAEESGVPKLDANQRNLARDVLWAYENLDHPRVEIDASPSAGAVSLLSWARSARQRFYEQVLPRALHAKAIGEADCAESPDADGGGKPGSLHEMLVDFTDALDRRRTEGVPQEMIDDTEAMVRSWANEHCPDLPSAATASLICHLGGLVYDCSLVAAKATQRQDPTSQEQIP